MIRLPSLALAAALLVSTAAHAQIFRAYLAPSGNDANPCNLAQPCRLLPAAIAAVASGGEIWMLDSANYNATTVNVTKSVTILAVPGALGSIVAAGGPAISFGVAGGTLVLRNVVIVPLPGAGGTDGIYVSDGAKLTLESSVVANLPGTGINVQAPARVRIVDSTIRDNAVDGLYLDFGARATVTRSTLNGNGQKGVHVFGRLGATTTADVSESTLSGNNVGILVTSNGVAGFAKATVRKSTITHGDYGIQVLSATPGPGALAVAVASDNVISNTGQMGIWVWGGESHAYATRNTVTHNPTAFVVEAGVFATAGNNALRNNGADTATYNGGLFTSVSTM